MRIDSITSAPSHSFSNHFCQLETLKKEKQSSTFIMKYHLCTVNGKYCTTVKCGFLVIINAVQCNFIDQMCCLLVPEHSDNPARQTEVTVLSARQAVQLSAGFLWIRDCPLPLHHPKHCFFPAL